MLEFFQYSLAFFMLIILVFNLIQSKLHNRFFAYFLLIVFHGNLYNLFNPNYEDSLYFEISGLFISIIHYGPVLYLYLLSLLKKYISTRTILIHLLIPILISLLKFLVKLFDIVSYKGIIAMLYLIASSLLLLFYLIKGYRLVRDYKNNHGIIYKFRFRLFYYTVNSYFILLFLSVIVFGIFSIITNFQMSLEPAKLAYNILFFTFCFFLCFYGLTEAVWIKDFFIKTPLEKLSDYKIDPDIYQTILDDMRAEKSYLNPNINLDTFSRHLKLTSQSVTTIIKSNGHKNFNSFINDYRIECFKHKLNDTKYKSYTLSGIAFDCGFKSKATFFRVFKEKEGMTPNQYMKSH